MGAWQSLQEQIDDVSALADETAANSTPARPVNKRILSLDPRSPSEEIDRTPIAVEKTPKPEQTVSAGLQGQVPAGVDSFDPRSPTADFTRTPINPCLASASSRACQGKVLPDVIRDPRSPTVDFTRTPMVPGSVSALQKKISADEVVDPRSPTVDFTRTPINPCLPSGAERQSVLARHGETGSPTSATTVAESGIESAEVSPVRDLALELDAESPDSAFSVDDISPGKLVLSTEADSSPVTSINNDVDEPSVLENLKCLQVDESTPKLPALKSRPQALSKLSKLAVEATKLADSSVPRSPLSSVKNSRAGLGVLQKNAMHGNNFGGVVVPQSGVDKENFPY